MPQWFVRQMEVEVGPLSSSELLGLVRQGSVVAETLVRKDDSAWFEARTVGGLFDAAARPSVEYSCPDCGTRVTKPPCYCPRCKVHLRYARPKVIEHTAAVDGVQPRQRSESMLRWLKQMKAQRDHRSS